MPVSKSNSDSPTYRMRFEFVVSHFFNVDAREFPFDLAGYPAILKSVHDRPLKQSNAVVIQVGGFRDKAEAICFGHRLQRATTLAATKTDLGVDVGNNRARSSISNAIRRTILEKFGTDLRDRIHGVDAYREDIPATIFLTEARATVSFLPQTFVHELDASYTAWSQPVTPDLEHALRLRAEANLTGDGLARMILAIASVEALTPDEFWTPKQQELLRSLADTARTFAGFNPTEIEEVVERITGQRRLSVNQGFRRLFDRIGLQEIWPRWNDLYGVRSRVLHGDAPPDLARSVQDEAMKLSKQIVLTAAAREIKGANVMLGNRQL